MMHPLNTLPTSSLVPFQTRKLAAPQLLWRHSELARELDFSDYGYCAPHEDDPEEAYLPQQKEFFSERYGGRGVGSNGGGARCGWDGAVQVKGIGRNSLVGRGSDFWHMHGGANLQEGIREALWGEICHGVLPHGGVRVLGLIATGTQSYFERDIQHRLPRVLILRQAALRPAHYMRAINFSPVDSVLGCGMADAQRTRDAIREIDLGLAPLLGRQPKRRHDPEFINAALLEMARRFAAQVAAARAKRMPHGAINCSNIALDGRYLDYGTISTISDYGRIVTARGNPDLWHQHGSLQQTFVNLLFYLRNYLPGDGGRAILGAEQLQRAFTQHFEQRLALEFVKLSGIPEQSLVRLDPTLLRDFGLCLGQIIARGNKEPFKLPQMPAQMGAFHVNSILQTACLCKNEAQMREALPPLLDDERLRNMLAFCFSRLRKAYLSTCSGSRRPAASLFIALNCLRVNTCLPQLYHPHLETTLVERITGGGDKHWVGDFIAGQAADAIAMLADPVRGAIAPPWFGGAPVIITEQTSKNGVQTLSRQQVIDQLAAPFTAQQKHQLSELCQSTT